MVRFARDHHSGELLHIVANFVNDAFRICSSADRHDYLGRAAIAFARSDCEPLAYALMSSHVHWVLIGGEKGLGRLFQSLHGGFATYINRTQSTSGPVFDGRYKVLGDRNPLALIAYVHNNPVRAGLVINAAASSWTSHRAYLGVEEPPSWLDVEKGMRWCGFARHETYAFDATVTRQDIVPPSAIILPKARAAIREAMHAPVELGTSRLTLRGLAHNIVQQTSVLESQLDASAPLNQIMQLVAEHLDISWTAVRRRPRHARAVNARRIALMVWVRLGRNQVEMARALGIGESSASQLLSRSTAATAQSEEMADRIVAQFERQIPTRQCEVRP